MGVVDIWKEAKLYLGDGKGFHHVRAYHQPDEYGPFFDWVNVQDSGKEDYVPAKALLLYRFNGECFCMCWKALPATATERKRETNIAARWKMQFLPSGLPALTSVPMKYIQQTLFVYQHFNNRPYHFPQAPITTVVQHSQYLIDEVYERYAWALNYLDKMRWEKGKDKDD